ncbi:hypothetical protein [Phycicoccus sp. Soil748]|uniref:hypothetical protein n=1 Tax=Phycicoccus sp. Soil748 TaxID=1736397 RepID=UPI000703AF3B|nr:hypothetical protein [Phycicoccus sp. Soil748]KRE55573.1 hypothetical protein ASG70_09575 [Phycicoccus sp. Soil748]
MRGIARTDSLVRLVMWGALLAVAWILFSPGKASASEHPVQDVVRSTTSLTGAVRDVPKALPQKDFRDSRVKVMKSVVEPVLTPVSTTTSALDPVVATTAHSVRAVVDSTVATVDATTESVPVLAPSVREITGLVDQVADALPVIGSSPVVELPLPAVPSGSGPSTSSPVVPAGAGVSTVSVSGDVRADDSAAPATRRVSGLRPVVDVTAEAAPAGPISEAMTGGNTHPGAADGAGPTGATAPRQPQPWPSQPTPASPAPAPASAGSTSQLQGADVPAVLPSKPSTSGAAAGALPSSDDRAPGALNTRPGLRPD